MVRVTIEIDDDLLELAEKRAALARRTLRELIEEALRAVLAAETARPAAGFDLPVSKTRGGTLPGVDLTNNAVLLDLMDEPRSPPKSD